MSIAPITTGFVDIPSLFSDNKTETVDATGGFADILGEVYGNVVDTNAVLQADAVKLINGEIDDLHTIYNDMTKASIAVETFVAIKNTTVASFQQIMQTQM